MKTLSELRNHLNDMAANNDHRLSFDDDWTDALLKTFSNELAALAPKFLIISITSKYITDLTPLTILTELTSIEVSWTNELNFSPLKHLQQLTTLSLSGGNTLSDLSSLAELLKLQHLALSFTQVSDLSPLAQLTALSTLKIFSAPVSELSPLAQLTALESLDVSDTKVSDLSPLKTLIALKSLNLSHTEVTDLSALKTLATLKSLGMRNTSVIDILPLANLTALESLDLSHTEVTDLSALKTLATLQHLYLSETSVIDLSPLTNLTALEFLDLSNTKVSDLSPLEHLDQLQELNLDESPIETLKRLAKLPNLLRLKLRSCPDFEFPFEIMYSRRSPVLLRYIRDMMAGKLVPLGEAMIQVVGEPGVGKSWFCNRVFRNLPNPPVVPKTRDQSYRSETHDYDILHLDGSIYIDGTHVRLHIRDYGGQHILHGVHELSLNEGCLYLLILDATRSQLTNRIDYWLKFINYMAGASVVMLIEAKCDQPAMNTLGNLDLGVIQANSKCKVKGFLHGLSTVAGNEQTEQWREEEVKCEEIYNDIKRELGRLRSVRVPVSRVFLEIKKKVADHLATRALMTVKDYRKICRLAKVDDEGEQDAYLYWLQHLGIVSYFGTLTSDHYKDEAFNYAGKSGGSPTNMVQGSTIATPLGSRRLSSVERSFAVQNWIINPSWLNWPLYEIIRESENREHKGILMHSLINELIDVGDNRFLKELNEAQITGGQAVTAMLPEGEAETRKQIVFDIILNLIRLALPMGNNREYWFPRGLDPVEKSYQLATEHFRSIPIELDFFPEAAFHRFMVGAKLRGEVIDDWIWRYGVVLQLHDLKGQPYRVTVKYVPDAARVELSFHDKDAQSDKGIIDRIRQAIMTEMEYVPNDERYIPLENDAQGEVSNVRDEHSFTDNQREILETMVLGKAFSEYTMMTADEIAEKANGLEGNSIKRSLSGLTKMKVLEVKKGSQGGYWIPHRTIEKMRTWEWSKEFMKDLAE